MDNKLNIGTMISECSLSAIPIILKNSGFDFFIIDTEHGGFDNRDIMQLVLTARLKSLRVLIRLADNGRKDIIRFCDMGANGFILPMTESAQDIAKVIMYAKYPPEGKRGVSTFRAHTLYNPPSLPEYMNSANSEMSVFAQIETKKGLENAESILGVTGISGVFVGPNDLSADLGCIGNKAPILSAMKQLGKVCAAHSKAAGVITTDTTLINQAKQSGYTMLCVGSELSALQKGLTEYARYAHSPDSK